MSSLRYDVEELLRELHPGMAEAGDEIQRRRDRGENPWKEPVVVEVPKPKEG